MNTRQLESFIVLAEELNFRRAAERTMLTQPALSQQLRQMEQELQVTLFARTNRQVRLTPAGEAFLASALALTKQMKETCDVVRQIAKGVSGNIVIGATTPAIYILLPDIVREMKKAIPNVNITLHEMDTAVQEEELKKNHIDIGIGHSPFQDKTLGSYDIAKIPFDVVMAQENPLTETVSLSMRDIKSDTSILFPRRMAPSQYDNILSLCLQNGFSPRNIIEVGPAQAIIAFAATGQGIGFIASKQQQFRHPHVIYRSLEGERPYFTLGAIYRVEDKNPVIETFKTVAQKIGTSAQ